MKWLILSVLIVCAALGWFFFLRAPDFARISGHRHANVVIITLDTTRADKLGCYGAKNIRTPAIDSLAANGILFEHCISPAPLTLPAHTSIFTGTYPLFHGVRDNAAFVVPDKLTTLAEILKQHGYKTGAFVSSFVLDSRWGLNQGFDDYFDHFNLNQENLVSIGDIQRPANQTIDQAIAWLKHERTQPFFLWVHLYDPHAPYEPPPAYQKLYPQNPYLGEIAFADEQIGRLLSFLRETDLAEKTYIVFAADHGESLGQHKENEHGFFIYQETLHVPLIISTAFRRFHSIRRNELVSLVDVMPTILDMLGIQATLRFQGNSLLHSQNADRVVYSETFYPLFHFGWSELEAIQNQQYKFILSSDPEFFDLQKDPGETTNIANQSQSFQETARRWIAQWSQDAEPENRKEVDEETQQKLAALGYVGTFTESKKSARLLSPREKIDVYRQLSAAREWTLEAKYQQAEEALQRILKTDPEVVDAFTTLGNVYLKQNRMADAVNYFQKALNLNPTDISLLTGIAACKLKLGQTREAEAMLQDSLKQAPADSRIYFMLGNVKHALKDDQGAIEAYKKCVDLNPKSASAYNMLASLYVINGDLASARKYADAAAKLDPQLSGVHYTRAQLYEKQGNLEEAAQEYLEELKVSTQNFQAAYNLSVIYRQLGNAAEEERFLRKSIDLNSQFPLSYLYLARMELEQERDYQQAIDMTKKALDLPLEAKYRTLGYFLLADLYNRTGQDALSREYALKGRSASRP